MKKSIFLERFLQISTHSRLLHEEVLSAFQKENFERYYKNPFPLENSAVLVCIFEDNNEWHTILVERTKGGKHSGEISFPGGKYENTDNDFIDTAIRETTEEIGIKICREQVIGQLSKVAIPISKFMVFPIVAVIEKPTNFIISQQEITKVICANTSQLAASLRNREIIIKEKSYSVPSFVSEEKIIWGATAMIINELLWLLNKKK